MADIYSAIILDDDYWDGTESWAGEADEDARDAKYSTRRFTSLSAWEADRDGNAAAADPEIANIFGPWESHDAVEIDIIGWTNKPAITIQTIGDDARSQDGKFDSNSCYVLENDSAYRCIDIDESGHNITLVGMQFYTSNTGTPDWTIALDNDSDLTVKKCYFHSVVGMHNHIRLVASTAINLLVQNSIFRITGTNECQHIHGTAGSGSVGIYNCTLTGSGRDCIEDDEGTWTVKNCAVFNNLDDFQDPDTIDFCASDDGDGTNAIDWDAEATDWAANFTDYSNGDFTVKDTDADIYLGSDISQADDANVPSDDIIGTARNTGAGEAVCIGAYEYVVAGGEDWSGKINGIASANIAKVNGIAIADIAKINGV